MRIVPFVVVVVAVAPRFVVVVVVARVIARRRPSSCDVRRPAPRRAWAMGPLTLIVGRSVGRSVGPRGVGVMIRRGVPHVVKTTRTPSVSSMCMVVVVVVVVVGEEASRENIR